MVARDASDLHLGCGTVPQIRLHGNLEPLQEFDTPMPADTRRLVYSVLTEDQQRRFEEDDELDLSFGVEGLARFRCNVHRQRGALCAAMRVSPYRVRTFEELRLPAAVQQRAGRHEGLVLVTGPTGARKSTTLAARIDKVNSERRCHIVTIEDPIELVRQREIASDTHSSRKALEAILRQDPGVVLVGEMRDIETIQAPLAIAETGHPTVGTLPAHDGPGV